MNGRRTHFRIRDKYSASMCAMHEELPEIIGSVTTGKRLGRVTLAELVGGAEEGIFERSYATVQGSGRLSGPRRPLVIRKGSGAAKWPWGYLCTRRRWYTSIPLWWSFVVTNTIGRGSPHPARARVISLERPVERAPEPVRPKAHHAVAPFICRASSHH
jgi:hypothetical protein